VPSEGGQATPGATRDGGLVARPAFALVYVLALALTAAGAVRGTLRAHAERELSRTGKAQWIWYTRDVREPRELAFVATRDVVLPRRPARATAKVFSDRWHVLWVNGRRAGSGRQRPGDPLALHSIETALKPGVNRIAIEAGSDTGVGGLLFSLDLSDAGRNAVVSDGRWRVDPSREAIRSGGRYAAAVWGRPPMYPWGWPRVPRPKEVGSRGER
jgi:hypothetical protein